MNDELIQLGYIHSNFFHSGFRVDCPKQMIRLIRDAIEKEKETFSAEDIEFVTNCLKAQSGSRTLKTAQQVRILHVLQSQDRLEKIAANIAPVSCSNSTVIRNKPEHTILSMT